ncbi:partial Alpha-D-kanosaminyltransferase, partial [Patescibacteria group bacterium]
VIPIHLSFLERTFLYPFVRGHRKIETLSMEAIRNVFQRKMFDLMKGSDLIHCIHNGASFYGYTALKCARKLGIPFVFTPLLQLYQGLTEKLMTEKRHNETHPGSPAMHTSELFLSPRGYHDKFWLKVCNASDALIAMTRFEKEFLSGKGIDTNKIYQVGVGPILSERYNKNEFRDKYNIGNKNMVLFLGRKHECKGLEELLKAAPSVWEMYPRTCFCFIGPKEGNSPAIFKKYEDERIVEIDKVDLYEKTSAIEACDILCMPSFFEALGGVFLEAWMFEKPVIAGNTPPLQELTGNGQGGFLVNLDSDEIAQKIINLIDDDSLRKKMGTWGKNMVVSKYSWEIITDKVERLYFKIVR